MTDQELDSINEQVCSYCGHGIEKYKDQHGKVDSSEWNAYFIGSWNKIKSE